MRPVSPGRGGEPFAAPAFGGRLGFGARPAVIVVDLVNAFTDPESALGSRLDEEVDATAKVLAAARERQLPAFFTTVWYDEPDLGDAGLWAAKIGALSDLRRGSAAVVVDERLGRQANEPLVMKKYASAFFGTDLASRLTSRGVDTVIVTGCTTSGCVRATAVDAIQLGFRPIVVREAVGDRSADAHRQSLFDLEQKYADVVSTDDVVAYLTNLVPGLSNERCNSGC